MHTPTLPRRPTRPAHPSRLAHEPAPDLAAAIERAIERAPRPATLTSHHVPGSRVLVPRAFLDCALRALLDRGARDVAEVRLRTRTTPGEVRIFLEPAAPVDIDEVLVASLREHRARLEVVGPGALCLVLPRDRSDET